MSVRSKVGMRSVAATCLLAFVGCSDSDSSVVTDVAPERLTDPGVLAELPDELSYLVKPALKYGRFQFDIEILDFLDSASGEQLDELAAVAERVRLNEHYPEVSRFLDEYPITDHEQSACLYFLFGVLDHADLTFESDVE